MTNCEHVTQVSRVGGDDNATPRADDCDDAATVGDAHCGPDSGNGISVFWTGGDAAKDAATKFALENGGTTLEMTEAGQAAAQATEGLPWEEARPIWETGSQSYAQSASGQVHVFINLAEANPDSIWATTELPTLIENPNVTDIIFHLIGG